MSTPFWHTTPVRFSHLRAYGRSPAHGAYSRIAPKGDETLAMERGTAVHALIFGNKRVVGFPGKKRYGKEFDAFAEKHPGDEILTMAEYDKALRMAEAVIECKLAAPMLKGISEATLLFKWMGLECRSTPDVRGEDFVTEVKTSSCVDPMKFIWHAKRMHYHAQMRFESIAAEKYHCNVKNHWVVAVESEPPHPVVVYRMEPEALEEGEKLLMLWVERLKNCEASNSFPGYADYIVPMCWPKDEFMSYEEAA